METIYSSCIKNKGENIFAGKYIFILDMNVKYKYKETMIRITFF